MPVLSLLCSSLQVQILRHAYCLLKQWCIEMLVLSYTTRTHGAQPVQKGSTDVSLDVIPFGHRFLQVCVRQVICLTMVQSELLRSEGRAHLQLLVDWMKQEGVKASTITSIISSMATVARQRPTLMGQVITELVNLESSPPSTLKKTQVSNCTTHHPLTRQ